MTIEPDVVWGSREGFSEKVVAEPRREEIVEQRVERRTDKRIDRGIGMFRDPEREGTWSKKERTVW